MYHVILSMLLVMVIAKSPASTVAVTLFQRTVSRDRSRVVHDINLSRFSVEFGPK